MKPLASLLPALLLCFLTFSATVSAKPIPASLFTDHGILQRGMKVPVWGKADPGEKVMVSFGGQEVATTADAQGNWKVSLEPMEASATGRNLTIRGTGDPVVLSSSEVPQPTQARYAWAMNPQGCNLYNKAGLPASPFRTSASMATPR